MMNSAIRRVYGFNFPSDCKLDMPESLYDVAEIGMIAEKYEIAGLLEWATETADNLLTDCLGDEERLGQFLAFDRFRLTGPNLDFGRGCIQANLKKLRGREAFQNLLRMSRTWRQFL